jgi:hypothetical protein
LKFKISSEKDLEIYRGFLETAEVYDVKKDLDIGFYGLYPEMKEIGEDDLSIKEKVKKTETFVNSFYKKHREQIESGGKKTVKDWEGVSEFFYQEVNRILNHHPWPEGKYVGYMTIWGIYPRFLDNRTFSVPYEHSGKDYQKVVIAHEMLHFIFYDYLSKKIPELNEKEQVLWNLTEIFNVLAQNSPEWLEVFESKTKPYPQHHKLIEKLEQVWQEKDDLDSFIVKSVEIIESV